MAIIQSEKCGLGLGKLLPLIKKKKTFQWDRSEVLIIYPGPLYSAYICIYICVCVISIFISIFIFICVSIYYKLYMINHLWYILCYTLYIYIIYILYILYYILDYIIYNYKYIYILFYILYYIYSFFHKVAIKQNNLCSPWIPPITWAPTMGSPCAAVQLVGFMKTWRAWRRLRVSWILYVTI